MRTRRLGILSAGLALGALGLGATGCADETYAARVGGQTITEGELHDELEALKGSADPQQARQLRGDLRDSYSQQFAGEVLQQRIILLLAADVLHDQGAEVTGRDVDQARQQMEEQYGPSFTDLPDDYEDQVVEDQAAYNKLNELEPDEVMAAFEAIAARTEVDINPRYGSWDSDMLAQALTNQGMVLLPPDGAMHPGDSERQAAAESATE